jgi:flagellar motor switch protein FliN/FliY
MTPTPKLKRWSKQRWRRQNKDHEDSMSSLKLDEFSAGAADAGPIEAVERSAADLAAVYDVPVNIQAVLGRSSMEVAELLRLTRGSVIELDRKVGEAIDIYVNNRLVARGEVVIVEEQLGVTMTEIIKDGDGA